jgi:GAF domain-containing protein
MRFNGSGYGGIEHREFPDVTIHLNLTVTDKLRWHHNVPWLIFGHQPCVCHKLKVYCGRPPHFPDLANYPEPVTGIRFRKIMGAQNVMMLCGTDNFNVPNLTPAERAAEIIRRCAAIDRYDILDSPNEPEFDEIANLAAAVCEASFAAISFVCEDRQWFKSEVGLGVHQTPISMSFCAYAIRQPDIFVVTDAKQHLLFADNPLVTENPKLRFYAGMPIQAADGTPIATLCVLDSVARPAGLTPTQLLTLRVLGRQVEAQLELRRSIKERDHRAAEQRTAANALQWIATHDSLTHLGNRTLFHSQLALALKNADRDQSGVAVILIDVDHFKQINDSLGHDAGDAVLCAFASRLRV